MEREGNLGGEEAYYDGDDGAYYGDVDDSPADVLEEVVERAAPPPPAPADLDPPRLKEEIVADLVAFREAGAPIAETARELGKTKKGALIRLWRAYAPKYAGLPPAAEEEPPETMLPAVSGGIAVGGKPLEFVAQQMERMNRLAWGGIEMASQAFRPGGMIIDGMSARLAHPVVREDMLQIMREIALEAGPDSSLESITSPWARYAMLTGIGLIESTKNVGAAPPQRWAPAPEAPHAPEPAPEAPPPEPAFVRPNYHNPYADLPE